MKVNNLSLYSDSYCRAKQAQTWVKVCTSVNWKDLLHFHPHSQTQVTVNRPFPDSVIG